MAAAASLKRRSAAIVPRNTSASLALRQYRECARRKSKAFFHFRPSDNNECALWRPLGEIGHDLDLVVPVLEDVSFPQHFLGGIGVHRFMPRGDDAALLVQELDSFERPGRK